MKTYKKELLNLMSTIFLTAVLTAVLPAALSYASIGPAPDLDAEIEAIPGNRGFVLDSYMGGVPVSGHLAFMRAEQTNDAQERMSSTTISKFLKRALVYGLSSAPRCYERALKSAPQLGGTMSFIVVFATEGHVASVSSQFDTVKDAALSHCIVTALNNVKTARPIGEQILAEVPLQFQPALQLTMLAEK